MFERNVFINCPFDPAYKPLLHTLVFTLSYCGLIPRIATERSDSGEVRIKKIIELILESKYSIHDISRIEPLNAGDLPRFNMPFELGIDVGSREMGEGRLREKRCLVLEEEKYRYQKVLSDISGNDIKAHEGDPKKLVRSIRNWLVENQFNGTPSANKIWEAYNLFYAKFQEKTEELGFDSEDVEKMPMAEYLYFVGLLSEPGVSPHA